MRKRNLLLRIPAMILVFCLSTVSVCAAEGKVIVSLGDSYSSGEGIEPFYGQEEEMAVRCLNPDWVAHRSEKSWPGMLTVSGVDGPMKEHRGENWFFAAASGARAEHLYLMTEEEIRDGKTAAQEKNYDRGNISGTGVLPPQLDVFDEVEAKGLKADYVTVTIGGNNIGFQILLGLALLTIFDHLSYETAAEEADELWDIFYTGNSVREKIRRAYTDIAARAGDQATILVAGYPMILSSAGEDSPFSEETVQVISLINSRFNRELRDLAKECREEGLNICFVSVEEAFEGHGAYAEDPWINPIIIGAREQDLKDFMPASAYSMHLNEKGAAAYAACVQEVIDRLEAERAE